MGLVQLVKESGLTDGFLNNILDKGSLPGLGKIPWGREWQSSQVLLPGEFHGQRSLAGYLSKGSQRVGQN